MSIDLQQGTIGPSAIIAIVVIDSDGQERRIECEPPPHEAHFVQIVRGGRVLSSRAFWSAEDMQCEYEVILAAARRKGRLSTVSGIGLRASEGETGERGGALQ
ncbi:hypothetical protein [Rhizobium mayense]|uniref:hypothetical protein n=1 Tax=Rhizobium mayense TaxID=1312184 RepID=UPI00398C7C82